MYRSFSASLFASFSVALMIVSAGAPALAQSKQEEKPAVAVPSDKPQVPSAKQKPGEPVPPERRAECAWTGQRVVSLLWRDDVNTAREQTRFYELFNCPAAHLAVAFRCVIEQSESQPDQNDLTARVYGCWMSPETRAAQE